MNRKRLFNSDAEARAFIEGVRLLDEEMAEDLAPHKENALYWSVTVDAPCPICGCDEEEMGSCANFANHPPYVRAKEGTP